MHVWRDGRRNLWQFLDGFYRDDDGLGAEDVKALVLQRKRRLEQKLQSARSLMRAEENGRPTRAPIPTDLRRMRQLEGVAPESIRSEVAESAMLLSQGARRAIEMMREAENGDAEPLKPATAARAETHTA